MINSILQIKTQLQEIWAKTTRTQKAVIVVLPLVVFITLSIFIVGASQPDYQTLATYKDIQEAAAVKNKLDEKKISYKLSDNGMTILVPSKDIDDTRLSLASEGLPTGGVVGYELFDQQKFGETDADRKAKYIRAIQGELTRTIQKLDGVENARVQVVMPEPSLFSEDQKDATASIMLKLEPYKKIEDNQIVGLVHLVSGSVEGLKPENVTVVDANMNDLTEGLDLKNNQNTPTKLTITQYQLQQEYQKNMQKDIQTMLERITGPGKAVVRVKADLDFDQVQKKSEQYTGDPKVRSEQISEESAKGTSTSPTGTPGTNSNIPGYQTSVDATNTETEKSDKTRNYEIDKTEENRIVSPGSIKKLSVAVVVDGQMNSKQKQDIQDLVKSAAGIDINRGDQVAVSSMQFDTKYQDELKKAMDSQTAMRNYLTYGAFGILAFVIAIISFVLLRRKKTNEEALNTEMTELGSEVDITVDDLIINERELTPEEAARERIREQVEQLAQENPDGVAQLLKTWLAEE